MEYEYDDVNKVYVVPIDFSIFKNVIIVPPDIRLKYPTKKKFIKLIMAKGYQRDEAIKIYKGYMNRFGFRIDYVLDLYLKAL